MAVDTFAEYGESGSEPDDSRLRAQASAALERLLEDHPAIAGEIKAAVRAHIYLRELVGRARQAAQAEQEAEQREATLAARLDPAGHRILGFVTGLVLVVALVVLDIVPLNWAAQAFGLNLAGTWLVTLILVVASVGAMLGFEVSRGYARRRGVLAAVVAAGYLALLVLRTLFLTTVAADSLPVAFLQSALLTGISVGLVLCGSAVLAWTRPFSLSRARSAARRTRRAATEARDAQAQAAETLQRHIGGIRQMLLPWALGPAAPAGVDRAKWAAAAEDTIRALFPTP
jgi:hypothetical protein